MASTSHVNSQHWQSYLNQFNKEIEDGESESNELVDDANINENVISIESELRLQDDSGAGQYKLPATKQQLTTNHENIVVGEIGTYFVDQEGNYYFQTTKNCIEQMTSEPPAGVPLITIKMPPKPKESQPTAPNQVKKRNTRSSKKTAATKTQENRIEYVFVLKDTSETTAAHTLQDDAEHMEDIEAREIFNDDDYNDGDDNNDIVDGEIPIAAIDNNSDDGSAVKEIKHKVVRVRLNKEAANNIAVNGIIYACNYCDYATYKRHLLARHLHAHTDERPYKCSVCERGFKTKVALLNHVNAHLGNKPHGCKYCPKAFTTAGELVRHVRYKHTGEKPHKCTECDYTSVEMSKLRRHMRCHTGERPYQCPHCTYASPDTFKLKRHLRTHTGEKPYECDICHARFTQSNSLKSHRLIHSVGDKPVFQCEYCPTTCGRKTDLRSHILNLHTSDKPIPCKRCGQNLPDRYSYKMHIKTHEGEKCYRCNVCPYASSSIRHLRAHTLVHTDEKPYVCEHCELAFRQPALLKRHQNLYHTKDYVPPKPREKLHVCPHCKRRFTHNGNLIRHMEMHDPESNNLNMKVELKKGRMKRIKSEDEFKNVIISEFNDNIEEFEAIDEEDYVEENVDNENVHDDNNIAVIGNEISAYENYERFEVVELDSFNNSTAQDTINIADIENNVDDDNYTSTAATATANSRSTRSKNEANKRKIDKKLNSTITTTIPTTSTSTKIFNNNNNNKKLGNMSKIKSSSSKIKEDTENKEYVAVELGDNSEYMVVEVINCGSDADENDQDLILMDNKSNEDCENAKNTNVIKIPVNNSNIKDALENSFDFQEDIDMDYEDDGNDHKESIQFLDFIEEL